MLNEPRLVCIELVQNGMTVKITADKSILVDLGIIKTEKPVFKPRKFDSTTKNDTVFKSSLGLIYPEVRAELDKFKKDKGFLMDSDLINTLLIEALEKYGNQDA